MPQGSIIFFGLIIGFLVYITDKGELGSYLAVLGLANMPSNPAGGVIETANTIPEQSSGSSGISIGGQQSMGNSTTTYNP